MVDRFSSSTKPLSEFENNLLICAKLEAVEVRTMGIACYIVEFYRRETEREEQRRKAQAGRNNTHFGEVGKRVKDVILTYVGCTSFDSQYGTCFLHKFDTEDGKRILWKTGTELGYADGMKLKATFTVKEHSEWEGWKQTKVSRMVEEAA